MGAKHVAYFVSSRIVTKAVTEFTKFRSYKTLSDLYLDKQKVYCGCRVELITGQEKIKRYREEASNLLFILTHSVIVSFSSFLMVNDNTTNDLDDWMDFLDHIYQVHCLKPSFSIPHLQWRYHAWRTLSYTQEG